MMNSENQQEFNNIIKSIKEGTYENDELSLSNIGLTDNDVAELCAAIRVAIEENRCHIIQLDLSDNQITTFNLEGLTQLELLCLYNNQLSILNVEELTRLKWLDSTGNKLTTLNVEGLTQLKELFLARNQLISFNVEGLTQLTWLDLSGNQLTSFNGKGLPQLKWLNLSGNQLTSFNGEELPQLRWLNLSNNQLTFFNGTVLAQLESLSLSGNQLTSIHVEGLAKLEYLSLLNNRLTSFNGKGLIQLKELDLAFNPLTTLTRMKLFNLLLANTLSGVVEPTLVEQIQVNNELDEKVAWAVKQFFNGKEPDTIESELKSELEKSRDFLLLRPKDSVYVMSQVPIKVSETFDQCVTNESLLFLLPAHLKERVAHYMCLDPQDASVSPGVEKPIFSADRIKP